MQRIARDGLGKMTEQDIDATFTPPDRALPVAARCGARGAGGINADRGEAASARGAGGDALAADARECAE